MTNTPSLSEEVKEDERFPTDWRPVNVISGIDCRQLSFDTFELRSASHTLVVTKEGFNLYRDGSQEGQMRFEKYLEDNGIELIPREDK